MLSVMSHAPAELSRARPTRNTLAFTGRTES